MDLKKILINPNEFTATYKTTFKDHLKLLKSLSFFIGVFFLIFIFLSLSNAKDFKIYAVVWAIITAIWSVPSLISHYNYYEQAKDFTIIEHEDFFELFQNSQTKICIYKKDTISLDLYMSANRIDSNFPSGKLPNRRILLCSN